MLELWENHILADAQYELNKRRQINLRRPEKLPNEDDVRTVREFVISRMSVITEDRFSICDCSKFIELRDCACSRLTLLNAWRGGQPARLTIDEWKDGLENKWIDKQRFQDLDYVDCALIKSLKVTYLTGKRNNHLVPVLIPEDTVQALQFLADQEIRRQSGISETNIYLFASTRKSEDHVSGWHSLHYVCDKLDLKDPSKLKSTSNRHRISTLFAALDLSKQDR